MIFCNGLNLHLKLTISLYVSVKSQPHYLSLQGCSFLTLFHKEFFSFDVAWCTTKRLVRLLPFSTLNNFRPFFDNGMMDLTQHLILAFN